MQAVDLRGKRSPWGTIDHARDIAPGIVEVATPSHGGIKLDRYRNREVPAAARRKGGWYEEDCDWSIVALCFPEAFSEDARTSAEKSAKDWDPDAYTAITGRPVTPAESYSLRERAFIEATKDALVVYSAGGGCFPVPVPPGKVGVYARIGGRNGSGADQLFLVDADRYRSRGEFGYVVQPDDEKIETVP